MFDHFQFALIHGPNIPGSYAILLFTASDLASIASHIHNWVLFLLWLHPFILSGVISPLISSSILDLPTWGVPLSLSYHFAFSFSSWGSQGKNTEVVCHSLLQWTTFCQTPSSNNTREDSTHGHHQMVNTVIRLIIFFAATDGEALYSQQKQGQELTVAQIMNSLLPDSDLN